MDVENTQFVFPMQGAATLRELNLMREEGILTDVTIVAEDRRFECHRAVLAASCSYFKAMFSYGLRESRETIITLHGIKPIVLDLVLQYAYTGMCVLAKSSVCDLFTAADLFGLLPLREAAVRFLHKCIDHSTCLQIYRLADQHCCKELMNAALTFARKHFSEIIMQDGFLELGVRTLTKYLDDDDLNVIREDLVYDAAMRWIRHDDVTRSQFVEQVLESVRLPFVKPEYLKLQATVDPLIYHNKACVRQVLEARTYQISGEFRDDFFGKQRKPRKCTSKEVVMVFGGEMRIGSLHEHNHDISYFDPLMQKWETMSSLPESLQVKAFSAISMGYEIYLTGGTVRNRAVSDVMTYYTYLNKWCPQSNMLTARYHHTCCCESGMIYAVGGTDGSRCIDEVERYDPVKNIWEPVPPLVHAVKCPALTAYQGKIYVFGGFSDQYVICQAIQVYEIESGFWTALSSPHIDYTCAHAALLSSKIYLLGGSSKVVKVYDPETDEIKRGPDLLQKRDNCGVTSVGSKLYVTGGVGKSSGSSMESAESFCPLRNKWELMPPMRQRLYRHGCVSIRIPIYQRDQPKSTNRKQF
ncbi:kelch-like protein 29 [Clavelina lepadiformis]|uniref:kelch-like protein 29 n=1 Tax=Clavelina lepadiformis TaxID=159417 RepID=UPI0040422810